MGRANVRNWYKLFGIISKDPIGENITMVISPTTPTAQFFTALARIRGVMVEVINLLPPMIMLAFGGILNISCHLLHGTDTS